MLLDLSNPSNVHPQCSIVEYKGLFFLFFFKYMLFTVYVVMFIRILLQHDRVLVLLPLQVVLMKDWYCLLLPIRTAC